MKKAAKTCTFLILLLVFQAAILKAADHDSLIIYYEVMPVNEIKLESDAVSLTATQAIAGEGPSFAYANTSYNRPLRNFPAFHE
jgi:hypothetical protein